jgi:hypothetical protein
MPACFSEQGGSQRRGGASAPQTSGDISNAYQETPDRETTEHIIKKQKCTTIFEEVEKFEDLRPRMHELLLTSPEGTRIYLRVRDERTLN